MKPRCSHDGCTNQVQKGGFCIRHGENVFCSHEGCAKYAKTGGVCRRHAVLVEAATHEDGIALNDDEALVRPKLVASRLQSDKGFEAWLADRKKKWQLQRCDFTDPKSIKAHFGYQRGKGKLRPMLSEIAKLRTHEEKAQYVRIWRKLTKEAQERWRKCRMEANGHCGHEGCSKFATEGGVCKRHGAKY